MFVHIVKNNEKEIVLQRPLFARAGLFLLLIALDVFCYVFFSDQIASTPAGDSPLLWVIPMGIVFIINLLSIQYVGPDELRIDLHEQTYTITKGYPFFEKITSGTFGDFYGLSLQRNKNRKGKVVSFTVALDWNAPEQPSIELAKTATLDEAERRREEYATRFVSIPLGKD